MIKLNENIDYADYKRFPIVLDNHTIMVIKLFKATDHLADIWELDNENKAKVDYDVFQESADQFIKQLEGCYSKRFIQNLRDICNEILEKQP